MIATVDPSRVLDVLRIRDVSHEHARFEIVRELVSGKQISAHIAVDLGLLEVVEKPRADSVDDAAHMHTLERPRPEIVPGSQATRVLWHVQWPIALPSGIRILGDLCIEVAIASAQRQPRQDLARRLELDPRGGAARRPSR